MENICGNCFEFVNPKRWALGYTLCLNCGDKLAKGESLPKPTPIQKTQKEIDEEWGVELKRRNAEKLKLQKQAEAYEKKRKLLKQKEFERLKKKWGEK